MHRLLLQGGAFQVAGALLQDTLLWLLYGFAINLDASFVLKLERHGLVLGAIQVLPLDLAFVLSADDSGERPVLRSHVRMVPILVRYVVEVLGVHPPRRTEIDHRMLTSLLIRGRLFHRRLLLVVMIPDVGLVILVAKGGLQGELRLGWRRLLARLLLLGSEVLVRSVAVQAGMAF